MKGPGTGRARSENVRQEKWMRRDEGMLQVRLDLLGLALLALLGFAWEELLKRRVRSEVV